MGKIKQSFSIPCFWKSPEPEEVRKTVERAAAIGFTAFELAFRSGTPFELLCRLARDHDMTISAMCGHGTLQDGLNNPESHPRIREELLVSIELASELGVPNLICLSGNRTGRSDEASIDIVVEGLRQAAGAAEASGVTLVMELLNSKVNHPGYQADHTAWGVEVCKRVGSGRVKLLYDIYHMQIMEGDLIRTITENIEYIGHFHTAGNPGRHEIGDNQEINYPAIMRAIAESGYDGYVAHEFTASSGDPLDALAQAHEICNVDSD
jgi:hydroxypyruvate isomerase